MKVRFDGLDHSDTERDQGFQIAYGPGKRKAFRWRWYLMLLLVLSPIAYFAWYLTTDNLLVEADGILTTEPISIKATHSGIVSEVIVEAGERAEANQVLLDLDSPVTEARLRVLDTNLTDLKKFQAIVLQNVREILEDHEDHLLREDRQLAEFSERYKTLKEQGLLLNSSDLQLLRDRRDVVAQLKNLEIDRQRAETILYSNDIANVIRDLEIDIAETRALEAQLNVRAPTSGIVNRVFALKGEFVDVGEPLFELANYSAPVVNVYLPPQRMAFAVVGSPVTIKFPDGSRYGGTVKAPVQVTETIPASLSGPFQGSKRAIKIIVAFDEAPESWIEGLPIKVSFPVLRRGDS